MTRRILALALLFFLVAPTTIAFLYLHIQKSQLRREIKWKLIASLDEDELVKFEFSEVEKNTQLKWEHAKEFEYRGEMYDVVKSEVAGDTTRYWCWWDHEETALNKQLKQLADNAFGNKSENQKEEFNFDEYFQSFHCTDDDESSVFQNRGLIGIYSFKEDFYDSISGAHLVPPPEIA